MKQSLKNLSYKRVYALSQNYSMIQNHSVILKIYEVYIFITSILWMRKLRFKNFGDLHRAHSQHVSGVAFDQRVSIFKIQCLLNSVLSCPYNQVLPLRYLLVSKCPDILGLFPSLDAHLPRAGLITFTLVSYLFPFSYCELLFIQ